MALRRIDDDRARPMTAFIRHDLAAELACDGAAVDRELAALDDLGLVFFEGDRVVSLVMAEKPPETGSYAGWSWAGSGLAAAGPTR